MIGEQGRVFGRIMNSRIIEEMKTTIEDSRDFVIEQARLNIERTVKDPAFVNQAKQVNASLASIVAMERNSVMLEALKRSKRHENLPGLPE